jgi:hypothetical protein
VAPDLIIVVDAILEGDHRRVFANNCREFSGSLVGVVGLDGEQYQVWICYLCDLSDHLSGPDGEISRYAFDTQPVFIYSQTVLAARHKDHVVACAGKTATEISANPTAS